jgi:hypothetical protein
MSRKDQLLRILAALDGHFAADDCSPADADRWRQLTFEWENGEAVRVVHEDYHGN